MRIIAGRDYYDSGLGLGHDARLVFVRSRDLAWTDDEARAAGFSPDAAAISFDLVPGGASGTRRPYVRNSFFGRDGEGYGVFPVKAYVCGKAYRGVGVDGPPRAGPGWMPGPFGQSRQVFWERGAFEQFLATFGLVPKVLNRYYGAAAGRVAYGRLFERGPVPAPELDRLATRRITLLTRVPQVEGRDGKCWRVNGDNLKDIQFFKVMDAYTLYQEIEMWLGGVLAAAANPVVEITDDRIRIAKHGFDAVRSFRRAKGA